MEAKRDAEFLAAGGERSAETLLDGRHSVSDGPFVHAEACAGRCRAPAAAHVDVQRLEQDPRALAVVEQWAELVGDERLLGGALAGADRAVHRSVVADARARSVRRVRPW